MELSNLNSFQNLKTENIKGKIALIVYSLYKNLRNKFELKQGKNSIERKTTR